MSGQMHMNVAQLSSPAVHGPMLLPRGLQRVRLVVRATSDKLPNERSGMLRSAKSTSQPRQIGNGTPGAPPQLAELQSDRDLQPDATSPQGRAAQNRESRVSENSSSLQPAATLPAQSDASTSGTAINQQTVPAPAPAPASANASSVVEPPCAADAQQGEDALLRQVDDFGAAWAERQQQQFVAAQAQLETRPAQGREDPSDEAAASLTELVLERLSRRNARAADAAAAADTASQGSLAPATLALGGGVGSAAEAAGFLGGIAPGPTTSASNATEERPEMVAIRRMEEQKRAGAEIITIDRDYANSGSREGYRPKVSTWGVFERPSNISEAYGGGRTLRPGDALEDASATAERKRRVALALGQYKKKAGLDVDPALEAQAEGVYDKGMAFFRQGQLPPALIKFQEASGMMAPRSRVGGLARLQAAITLDSLGRSQEAKELYHSLRGHPAGDIAKRAGRLLFGFQAMDNLKAHTMSYAPGKGAYEAYFRRVESSYSSVYLIPGGESEDLRLPTIMAASVVVAPLLLLGVKIFERAHL